MFLDKLSDRNLTEFLKVEMVTALLTTECVCWQMVCIVVPNESDVAAFKDYTPSADEAPAPPTPAAASAPATPPAQPTPAAAAPSPTASYPTHSVGMYSNRLN